MNRFRRIFWSKGKPEKRGLFLIISALLTYLLKRKVYDRLIPSSEVMNLVLNKDVKKVRLVLAMIPLGPLRKHVPSLLPQRS